jgi:hypothetical protein
MDFDDTSSPSLAEAIESALEAVKTVPDLSVPGLTVPAQPAGPADEEPKVLVGEIVEEVAEVTEEKPAAQRATVRKTSSRKASTRKKVEASAGSD